MESRAHPVDNGLNVTSMKCRAIGICWVFLATLWLCYVPAADAENFYRYRNSAGTVVVDYQVPPESVSAGYEILDKEGIVISTVSPALSAEERQAKDAEKMRAAAAGAELERLRKRDESLLLRYSSVADLEAARRRALGDQQVRVNILKGNRHSLKNEVENYQAKAAGAERAGLSIDSQHLQAIERLQRDIESTDLAIADRQLEIEQVAAEYESDISRFETLLELVKLRRTMSAPQ